MPYRELPPPPALARHVACAWIHEAARAGAATIVPDACADLISVDGRPPIAVGPATRTSTVELAAGTVIVGVRFRPASLALGLGAPPGELLDDAVDLAALWGATIATDHETPHARLAALLAAVARRLGGAAAAAGDPLVEHAVGWLARHPGRRVEELAGEHGVSARHLLRRVRAATGYAPKQLQRILRFQRAVIALRGARVGDLGRVAAACGYVDQAHFSREFRELAGAAPGALVGRDLGTPAMSEFFKTLEPARRMLRA